MTAHVPEESLPSLHEFLPYGFGKYPSASTTQESAILYANLTSRQVSSELAFPPFLLPYYTFNIDTAIIQKLCIHNIIIITHLLAIIYNMCLESDVSGKVSDPHKERHRTSKNDLIKDEKSNCPYKPSGA